MARRKAEPEESIEENVDETPVVETPEVESPDVPVEESSSEGQAFSVREFLRGHQVNKDFESDEDAATWLAQSAVQAQQSYQQAQQQWMQQRADYENQLRAFQYAQQQAQQKQPEKTPEQKAFEWKRRLPDHNIDLIRSTQLGPDGQLLPDAQYKVNEYQRALQSELTQLINDTPGYVAPILDHRFSEYDQSLEKKLADLEQRIQNSIDEAAYTENIGKLAYDQNGNLTYVGNSFIEGARQFQELQNEPNRLKREFLQTKMQNAALLARLAEMASNPASTTPAKRQELEKHNRPAARGAAARGAAEPMGDLHKPGALEAALMRVYAEPDAA